MAPTEEPNASQEIPRDVVFDILTRLPVKLLRRFRCVSKQWNSIIRDPVFAKEYMKRSPYFTRPDGDVATAFMIAFPWCNFPKKKPAVTIKNVERRQEEETVVFLVSGTTSESLNGLVCIDKATDHSVRVLNPTTREFITLPPIVLPYTFDPDDAFLRIAYYFGYDPVNDKHKVLSDYKHVLPYPYVKEKYVFVIGESSWRRIPDDCDDSYHSFPCRKVCVCINGILYYSARRSGKVGGDIVIPFDVESETFMSSILPPDPYTLSTRNCNLIQFDGRLAIAACDSLVGEDYISVWVLDDDKLNWIHRDIVFQDFTNINRKDSFHFHYGNYYIAGGLQDGDIIVVSNDMASCLCYLNVKLGTVKRVEVRCLEKYNLVPARDNNSMILTPHIESLVPLPEQSTYSYQ